MPNILQEITIAVAPEKVFAALIDQQALEAWWVTHAVTTSQVGSTLKVQFGEDPFVHKFEIRKLEPSRAVAWLTRDSLPEWNGTSITWDLTPVDSGTCVLFGQHGYASADGLMPMCSYHWAIYLTSLKDYLEKENGNPFPFKD